MKPEDRNLNGRLLDTIFQFMGCRTPEQCFYSHITYYDWNRHNVRITTNKKDFWATPYVAALWLSLEFLQLAPIQTNNFCSVCIEDERSRVFWKDCLYCNNGYRKYYLSELLLITQPWSTDILLVEADQMINENGKAKNHGKWIVSFLQRENPIQKAIHAEEVIIYLSDQEKTLIGNTKEV